MKNISLALKNHLQQENTTLCTMWKVVRRDGLSFGFTDNSSDLIYDGINYYASTGQNASNIKTSAGLNVDNLDVTANLGGVETSFVDVLDSPFLTEQDIRAGLWDLASVEIFLVNYKDLTMGKLIMRSGTIGEIKTGRTQFTAELRGMTQPLQQFLGRLFMPSCDANLFDNRCKVNASAFTFNGSVTSLINNHSWYDTSLTQTSSGTEYFVGGLIEWTSGLNTGLKMEVRDYTPGYIFIVQQMIYDIQVGDTYTIKAGCDKLSTTCHNRFNNIINFRGFNLIPGSDRWSSGR